MTKFISHLKRRTALTSAALLMTAGTAFADQVIVDDLIVQGSICAGQDCVNGESFGFDTLRLKENNLRIKAQDTSNSASFPTVDWQITFNDSSNGGANKFSIDDIDGGRTPFTIEASAPSNSLYVDDGGRIGNGTATPVVEMHIVDGDSPTMRLEQDGSSGFTPQTWDLASNEANFFIRDVTNGSQLPFRIQPGADTNSLYIANDNNIGIGTTSPDFALHIRKTDETARLIVEEASSTVAARRMLMLENNGTVVMTLNDVSAGGTAWSIQNQATEFRFANSTTAGTEFAIDTAGNVSILGGLTTGTAGSCTSASPCDGVFDAEKYTVPSITEHAQEMWTNKHLPAVGPTLPDQPVNITAKLLNMLNELEHAHIYIEQLHTQIGDLEGRLTAIEADKG
ncbi:MAG: hypothetical protein WA790_18380 [Sulfitobacter sp.]